MNKEILSTYDTLFEAVSLLETLTGREWKDPVIISPSIDEEEKLSFVKSTREELKFSLSSSLDDVSFYFSTKDKDSEGCLFDILFLSEEFSSMEYSSFQEWLEAIRAMKSEDFYEALGRKVFCFNQKVNDSTNMSVCKTLEDVLKLILQMERLADEKLVLQDVVLNRESHIKRILPLLEASVSTVKKRDKELKAYGEKFKAYWSKRLENSDILSLLEREVGTKLNMEPNSKGSIIRPSFFKPGHIGYAISMDEVTGEYTTSDQCTLGFLFGDEYTLSSSPFASHSMTQEQALKILKLLSDRSKYEILSYTKDKKAYGAELAQVLGITTATVSYHTSELVASGLLNMEKQGNRIYYSQNQKSVSELMEMLKKTLIP